MWALIERLINLFSREDYQEVEEEYFDDGYYQKYIEERNRDLKLFEIIVGNTPMKQIDWIIENGFEKFNYWYRCYETGKIYQPATVELPPPKTLDFFESRNGESYVIRGGRGNSRLLSWNVERISTFGELCEEIEEHGLFGREYK